MNINTTVITVGDLLNDARTYAVPIFQRSFAWEKSEIDEFMDDLLNLCQRSEKNIDYFMGSMVFTPHEESKKKTKILDGQQRFATFLLFLAALRDVLWKNQLKVINERIEELNRLIFRRDPVSLSENTKIELNRDDKVFFEELVTRGIMSQPKYESHKLLKEAYNSIKNCLSKKLSTENNEFIEVLLDAFLNRLKIIKIDVDSDINAHIIFETLNDRGLDLSVADLVKNYVFSLGSYSGQELELLVQIWKEIVDQVGDHNVTTFLRHFWISYYDLVRKDNLYKALKAKVTARNVRNMLTKMSNEAAVYSNFITPTHEFWQDSVLESKLEDLNILKVQQVYVLLLGLYNSIGTNTKKFKKMVVVLNNFSFRYNTICRLNPNELERVYSELSILIRKKKISEVEVIERLRTLAPSRTSFLDSFYEYNTKNSKLARHILKSINDYMLEKENKLDVEAKTKRINLEHIIPKKPDKEWNVFFKNRNVDPGTLIHKIGNMTILLDEYNRKLANNFFDKKKLMYKKSSLPLNKELKRYREFGEIEVNKRQKKMAKIAEDLWRM